MKSLTRYIDNDGIIHACAPAWSRYAFACRRTDIMVVTPAEAGMPLTCVWCATNTMAHYEDPIALSSLPPEWRDA